MERLRRVSAIVIVFLGLALALALGGCGTAPAAGANAAPIRHTITAADGQRVDVTEQVLGDRPAITVGTARSQAAQAVPNAAQAKAVDARYVALTIDGERATRNVWLVTYNGVEFAPNGCTCHVDTTAPNTVVAVDGKSGAVTLLFGADHGY